ncbi:hypothetical protein GQ43DRAFT_239940 [Delitschia confertaspora ATCC 74209]|uniref:20S-pre-rRNA D-site endonuclease NOB1 n=1 Tax=Delitschia confertaspora ATCC 74209 TaxID=1513339 RepID=A0A9P4JR19_9PLEO|nr:hypothetical protein GQ43DRAFT_239940 [Delitschia confertaspora ATCC 74209]
MASQKPVHSLIIDTGPLIKNAIEISTMRAKAEELFTTPAILTEIRDPATRSRVETQLLPFLKVRQPTPASYEVVANFSKKTGDFAVLSRQDLEILALAYEVECERLGGNWRLRNTPGQKGLNGAPPAKRETATEIQTAGKGEETTKEDGATTTTNSAEPFSSEEKPTGKTSTSEEKPHEERETFQANSTPSADTETLETKLSDLKVSPPKESSILAPKANPFASDFNPQALDPQANPFAPKPQAQNQPQSQPEPQTGEDADPVDDDSDGEWITPSNLKKHQEKDTGVSAQSTTEPKQMAVATMTTDFAMQNVLLQMNLNLLSTNMQRVKHLRTYILRCHACFLTTKQMDKQFCPRCGQPALTRVACSTSSNGVFKLHLAKNFHWNTRGNVFSIPKPVAGSANGRVVGGGKGGWGNELILAEDQKEYTRAIEGGKRMKTRDLMDEDYLEEC